MSLGTMKPYSGEVLSAAQVTPIVFVTVVPYCWAVRSVSMRRVLTASSCRLASEAMMCSYTVALHLTRSSASCSQESMLIFNDTYKVSKVLYQYRVVTS